MWIHYTLIFKLNISHFLSLDNKKLIYIILLLALILEGTVCPRSSDQYYEVTHYKKWVTASWTYLWLLSMYTNAINRSIYILHTYYTPHGSLALWSLPDNMLYIQEVVTHFITYYIKWVTISWTHSKYHDSTTMVLCFFSEKLYLKYEVEGGAGEGASCHCYIGAGITWF